MAWTLLNIKLSLSDECIKVDGGKVTATITVSGNTDGTNPVNPYTVTLKDDHFLSDTLWDSGPQSAGSGEHFSRDFEVELWCNKWGRVVGPAGSSHEKKAELYAHVAGAEREGATDNIRLTCTK